MNNQLKLLIDAAATLGECPRYDFRNDTLWFVDIVAKTLFRFDWHSEELSSRVFDEEIGCFGFCQDKGMILGMQSGFFYVEEPLISEPKHIVDPEQDKPWQRLNDGRCGPDGLFYAGSVNPKKDGATACLYRLENQKALPVMGDFLTFNGLVFDAFSSRVLYADTPQHIIYQAEFDSTTGDIKAQHSFCQFSVGMGRPDGAVQDTLGKIWSALYDGHAIVELSKDAVELNRIPIPCKHPTALCFAGPNLDTLIITTARQGHDENELEFYPKAGGVFALEVDALGFKEHLIKRY